jgi:hypothetical protein
MARLEAPPQHLLEGTEENLENLDREGWYKGSIFETGASEIAKEECQPHNRNIQLNLCGLMTVYDLLFDGFATLRNAY